MSLQLDTVFIWVNDLERALPFYAGLGLEPGPRYGPWQELITDGARFALHQGVRPTGPSTAVPSFRVDDLDAAVARVAEAGIEPTDPAITDTGAARFITFTDHDGNQVQLLERRGAQ